MPTVKELAQYLETLVPSGMKLDYDNVGLLVGMTQKEVSRVLLALDITSDVISEAVREGAELIVSHHPVIFESLHRIVDTDIPGKKLIALIRNGVSAICIHTNLDIVKGGVNDALAEAVGASVTGLIEVTGTGPDGVACGIGRVCELPENTPLHAFLENVNTALGVSGLRFFDAGRPVRKIAVVNGAGGDYVCSAYELGCDTLLSGEVKYHHWLDGRELSLNIVEADHFCTENIVMPVIRNMLLSGFPGLDVRISKVHGQTGVGF